MSEQADSVDTQEATPAGGEQAEQSIPKYRYDEVAARLRNAEESLRLKDEQNEYLRRAAMPQQPQDDHSEYEALGFDQNQIKGVRKLIEKEAQTLAQPLRAAVAHLAGSVEENQFLMNYGKDKSSYLPKIKAMKRDYAMRGLPLDAEMAYKMIRFDEQEAAPQRKAPRQEVVQEREASAPPPATKTAAKHFSEMSIEEKEAQLEEQFRSNGPI